VIQQCVRVRGDTGVPPANFHVHYSMGFRADVPQRIIQVFFFEFFQSFVIDLRVHYSMGLHAGVLQRIMQVFFFPLDFFKTYFVCVT